eukprot:RCo002281
MELPVVWGGLTLEYATMTFLYLVAVWWMDWPKASQMACAKALAGASLTKIGVIPDDNRSDALSGSGADGLPTALADGKRTPSPCPSPSPPFPPDFERVGVVLMPVGAPTPSYGSIDPEPQSQPSQGPGPGSPVEPTSATSAEKSSDSVVLMPLGAPTSSYERIEPSLASGAGSPVEPTSARLSGSRQKVSFPEKPLAKPSAWSSPYRPSEAPAEAAAMSAAAADPEAGEDGGVAEELPPTQKAIGGESQCSSSDCP